MALPGRLDPARHCPIGTDAPRSGEFAGRFPTPPDCGTLSKTEPLSAKERRPRLAALRQPWPYRRFRLASTAPGWLRDAMHLGGLVDPDWVLQLTLPVNWALAVDAELLWRTLADRLVLKKLLLQADGRQTLFMSGKAHGADLLELHHPDGTVCQLPALPEDAPVSALAALTLGAGVALPSPPLPPKPRLTQSLLSRDYPVAMGVLMMLATAVVVANLLTDLAYHWIDPRVRVR